MTASDDSLTPEDPAQAEQEALLEALDALMAPLAQLVVARGLPFGALQESMKRALVLAASAAHQQVAQHRRVSRVSTVTGINRREVTRLMHAQTQTQTQTQAQTQARQDSASGAPSTPPRPARGRSKASELFAHWLTARAYRGRGGAPRVLPRLGPKPSFESLAQEVTRDVHPRSLLDELVRLGLAEFDEAADTVRLAREGFVPRGDQARMLGFLSENVGDHLAAAVDNVVQGGRRHFEQAVFADGLSEASIAAVRALIGPQWKLMLQALVPPLQSLVEADATLPMAEQRRIRIGVYAYDDAAPPQAAESQQAPAAPQRKRLGKRPVKRSPSSPS